MIYDLKKTKAYEEMKKVVKEQKTETLVIGYKVLSLSQLNTEQILSLTVITNELEEREVLRFNEELFDYEFVV